MLRRRIRAQTQKYAKVMVALRAHHHSRCHLKVERVIDFHSWRADAWRDSAYRWRARAIPARLQWESVRSLRDSLTMLVLAPAPMPKVHPAESLLANSSFVANIWAAYMVAGANCSGEHVVDS